MEERNKDISLLDDDNTLTSARRYKACQSSSVNYERQTHSEDEKDSSLQHVRLPAENDKVAPKIARSFGKKFDKIDEAGRVTVETTGPTLSGERKLTGVATVASPRQTLPRKESLYQKKSVVGNTSTRKVNMKSGLLLISTGCPPKKGSHTCSRLI